MVEEMNRKEEGVGMVEYVNEGRRERGRGVCGGGDE